MNIKSIALLIAVSSCSSSDIETEDILMPTKVDRNLIAVDGELSNDEWSNALSIHDFRIINTPQLAGNKTEVYLTYDSSRLYIAFKCYIKSLPISTSATFSKDDERNASGEWIAVCLDGYADGLSAVFFLTNPSGGQVDGNLSSDGEPTISYSANWVTKSKVFEEFYTTEIALPFSEIPYLWGRDFADLSLKLVRYDFSNKQEYDYPQLEDRGMEHLSQFKKIRFTAIEKPDRLSKTGTDLTEYARHKISRINMFDIQTLDGRCDAWGDASVVDYKVFKEGKLKASSKPFFFANDLKEELVINIFNTKLRQINRIEDLEQFLERTNTNSFIVIRNDKILFEKYYNGFSRDSIATSFSVAKSFLSVLIGMAIKDGYLGGVDEPIVKYLPELIDKDARFRDITIRNLMTMTSGLRYEEGGEHNDDEITYYHPDLREVALAEATIQENSGDHFLYNNYNPLLLGIILEQAIGKSISEYVQEKIWEPLGMEYEASWSRDENGFEKMESGINARSIDFAKLGRLMLNKGTWNNSELLPPDWVEKSTQAFGIDSDYFSEGAFFQNGGYYSMFWWGIKRPSGKNDFFGLGNKGQYLYICPENNIIIIRNGIDYGIPPMRWARLLYEFASDLK